MTTTDLTTPATNLLNGGLSIVAVGNDKRPFTSWKDRQTTIGEPETIRRELADARATGVAVICGNVSGGLEVIDFDVPGFYESFVELVGDEINRLPVQQTGGGGYQVGYRRPNPGGNKKLAWSPSESEPTGREIAIETRGEGGYVVVPPSLHPSGNRYVWITPETFADAPMLTDNEADALLDAARSLCKAPYTRQELKARKAAEAKAVPRGRPSVNGEASVIDQFNQAVPIRDMLARVGYTPDPRSDEYTRPGDDASSGGVVILDDRSYHHSTNDPMHDGKHTVDSFAVFCEMEQGGEFNKAVRAAAVELGIEHKDHPLGSAWQIDGSDEDSTGGVQIVPLGQLTKQNPTLNPPVIDGILRRGETANIIAASKAGKSWLIYDLTLSIATGLPWLGQFDTTPGRVLLIDNELHPSTLAIPPVYILMAMLLVAPWSVACLLLGMRLQYRKDSGEAPPALSEALRSLGGGTNEEELTFTDTDTDDADDEIPASPYPHGDLRQCLGVDLALPRVRTDRVTPEDFAGARGHGRRLIHHRRADVRRGDRGRGQS